MLVLNDIVIVAEYTLVHVPVMFGDIATLNPLGRLSVKLTLLTPELPAGLVSVKVSVVD
jgi:hypothetical protein